MPRYTSADVRMGPPPPRVYPIFCWTAYESVSACAAQLQRSLTCWDRRRGWSNIRTQKAVCTSIQAYLMLMLEEEMRQQHWTSTEVYLSLESSHGQFWHCAPVVLCSPVCFFYKAELFRQTFKCLPFSVSELGNAVVPSLWGEGTLHRWMSSNLCPHGLHKAF